MYVHLFLHRQDSFDFSQEIFPVLQDWIVLIENSKINDFPDFVWKFEGTGKIKSMMEE